MNAKNRQVNRKSFGTLHIVNKDRMCSKPLTDAQIMVIIASFPPLPVLLLEVRIRTQYIIPDLCYHLLSSLSYQHNGVARTRKI